MNYVPTHPKRAQMHRYAHKGRNLTVPVRDDEQTVKRLGRELRPHVDAQLAPNVHGWRPGHSVGTALAQISSLPGDRLSFDIVRFFESVDLKILKRKVDRFDPTVWQRLSPWIPRRGLATGVAFSCDLGNLYLNDLDHRFPSAVRYCDNILIVDEDPERVFWRMSKQLADIGLECHDAQLNPQRFCKQALPSLDAHERGW